VYAKAGALLLIKQLDNCQNAVTWPRASLPGVSQTQGRVYFEKRTRPTVGLTQTEISKS